MKNFDVRTFPVAKFDKILARGLCQGVGTQGSQVCIEAAICEALGLSNGDDPKCVAVSVRLFKISLNDARWPCPQARAEGLRDLGLAQLGSLGVVNDGDFTSLLAKGIIQKLIPVLFRDVFPNNKACLAAADRCEIDGSVESARMARAATYAAAYAASAADHAASAADHAAAAAAYAAAAAAHAATAAAHAATDAAKYLNIVAKVALDVLKQLKSPGCELLT